MDSQEGTMDPQEGVQLKVGTTFQSWEDLKKVIVDEGVKTERVLVTQKKSQSMWKVRCRMSNPTNERQCPWRLRATKKSRTETITITVANLDHSCEAADHYLCRMHSKSDRLADRILDIIGKNRQTRPSFLRDSAQALVHPDIKYHTAYSAKQRCLKRLDGDQTESFKLIPAHCDHILERDPGAFAKYRAPDGHLDMLFICPSASREAYRHCRPMMALDGTHTRCMYPGILLLATTLDGNNTVIILAYCWVPSENEANWMLFLTLIRDAIPDLSKANTVLISDREKGLTDGVPHIFPHAHPAYCTWHLAENVHKHYGKEVRKLFEALPYVVTPAKFNLRLEKIEARNKSAAEYIWKTADPQFYSRALFPSRRWGHETSQQAESSNRALKPQRQEVTMNMSSQIWDYIMVKYFEKRELAASVTSPFPPNIMKYLKDIEDKATHLIAHPSNPTEVRITDDRNCQYLVKFEPDWFCSCGDFQDTLLPCVHAWRALTRLCKRHYDYVSPWYTSDTFRATYEAHLPVLLRTELLPDPNCGAPLKKRRKGRPTERLRMQFQSEEVCRLPRKCGVCGEQGHDKRKCPQRDAARQVVTIDSENAVNNDGNNEHNSSQESFHIESFSQLLQSVESQR